MTRLRTVALAAMALVSNAACDDHDHGDKAAHGDHEHHNDEFPTRAMTIWKDRSELFVEWDVLTVGRESRFLAHVTDMTDQTAFTAVAAGTLTVTLTLNGKSPISAEVSKPARLGIFIPRITPSAAGPCTLTISLQSPALNDSFQITPCFVHADKVAARKASLEEEQTGEISFLKEQQWPIAFATVAATKGEIAPTVVVDAKVQAMPGHAAKLTAATAGRFILATPSTAIGSPVTKGQVLGKIQPIVNTTESLGVLQASVAAANAERIAATASRDRLAKLVESNAVPKRRLEEAESQLAVAAAAHRAAKAKLASYWASARGKATATRDAFLVRSPIAGTLVAQSASHGENIAGGEELFTVIDLDRVWIEGRVFEDDVPKFEQAGSAWFTVSGRDKIFDIADDNGKLVTLGHVISPESRTVPVIYEVDNPKRSLRIGQFAKLGVATGPKVSAMLIPEAALIQDGNQSVVFVHQSGESFSRRVVSPGARSRGFVEVKSGLREGERVVTTGAYDIKLASQSNAEAAHGHAH